MPERSASPVVDAQVHIWLPEGPDRPWPPNGQQWRERTHRPSLDLADLLTEMDAAGVDRAVIVPPLFEGRRDDYALAAAAAHPDRFRVVPQFDIDAPDLGARLDAVVADPRLAGIRVAFMLLDAGPLADAADSPVWAAARERDLPVMVFCPGQLPELGGIARAHPGLRIAVDHLALSGTVTDGAIADELAPLLALSAEPGVSVKMTALPVASTEPYPHPALHAPARSVLEAFGPERVFWGSDLSRLRGPYSDCLSLVRDELGLSPGDADAVLGRSLLEWLRWP
ncbi:amidohydrolase family protein [Pseudonocardia ailaonensis]|uniref:Amidohydrolase family protein n=1 Tax=Pseudonocardia ailaonensis TaxID=367279 RepID=A0ABN2MU12_9PSEU